MVLSVTSDTPEYIQILTLLVALITAGLIPWVVSKNTRQHMQGQMTRDLHHKELLGVKDDLNGIKTDVIDVKGDIHYVKEELREVKHEVKNIRRNDV